MKGTVRILLIIGGTLSLGMGIIGIFVPVLPTTPFLLLSAACYARSSHRFYTWLMTNRWFGEYLRNYREGRGIPLRHKVLTLLALWITIGYTALIIIGQMWVKLVLFAIALAVTVHLLKTKTFRPQIVTQSPSEFGTRGDLSPS